MKRMLGVALGLALAGTAGAKEKAPPPPEPAAQPDWAIVRKGAEALLKSNLYDPGSAQIEWVGGWRWGHIKPFQLWSKRTWGWLGCANVNAKNRLGGYVGAEGFYVLLTPDGQMQAGRVYEVTSECDAPNPTPLQAAFMDAPATGTVSVADELTKLADLLAKGLITQAEFDAQKAKLLAR